MEATVESFVLAATSGRCERAQRLLEARPELADDRWAKLVLGREWEGDVSAPGGPRGWARLLYVTHSCFASADLARGLLARGADPNVTFTNQYGDMSALCGAAGVVRDPELTQALLEAGADPNDGESLYHCMESKDPACLRLLLDHGAQPRETGALGHAIDYHRIEHVRLLLDAGADPNEGDSALLVHAVRRGSGIEMVRLLGRQWSRARPQRRRVVNAPRGVPHCVSERDPAGPRRPRRPPRGARRQDGGRARRCRGGGACPR